MHALLLTPYNRFPGHSGHQGKERTAPVKKRWSLSACMPPTPMPAAAVDPVSCSSRILNAAQAATRRSAVVGPRRAIAPPVPVRRVEIPLGT